MSKELTLHQLARLVSGTLEGDGNFKVCGIAGLEEATSSQVSFVADEKHAGGLSQTKAAAVIVGSGVAIAALPLIRVENVHRAITILLNHFSPGDDLPPVGIHPSAVIAADAEISSDVAIGPGVSIAKGAKIGQGCVFCANVSIGSDVVIGNNTVLFEGAVIRWGCTLGNNVRIGPNCVIGYDGFGYFFDQGRHNRLSHIGGVVIEDSVELGACTCIDRAKFGLTKIGLGTKIDNLVQVAHNVQIGSHCVVAAGAGIAGSARLGDNCALGGGVGIRDNITLGNQVQCAAYSAVAGDLPDGVMVAGIPAGPAREKFRELQAVAKLPDMFKKVRELESRLEKLESPKDH